MNDLLGRKARTQVFPRRRPYFTCADQENLSDGIEHGQRFVVFFMRGSRKFFQGGGVLGPGPTARKPSGPLFCFAFSLANLLLFFFSPQLILFTVYRGGQMVLLQR